MHTAIPKKINITLMIVKLPYKVNTLFPYRVIFYDKLNVLPFGVILDVCGTECVFCFTEPTTKSGDENNVE
ncbi:MAG TPA: hypothetical protein ENI98_06470 [Gammaproteobacteria bacterium]|nr:hypothetical protein [Gammaproteobacteria bacterium]